MELLKAKDNITYVIGDVTFYIRPQATVRDKFELDTAGEWTGNGKFKLSISSVYKKLIELFVTGWNGVTQEGKPVPYSYDALLGLPADISQDWLLKLGTHIATETGILKLPEDGSKNG